MPKEKMFRLIVFDITAIVKKQIRYSNANKIKYFLAEIMI